nr:F-box protein At3g07870-like [Nicotiana tomentosiformis]
MDIETNNQKCQSDEPPTRYGFDSLPQEIVVDIASRLPITSLVQFKFVCKSFYNLSHDLELVNLYLSRAVKNVPCIIFDLFNRFYFLEFSDHGNEEAIVRKISTSFANSVPEFTVVGSCHVLLCVRDPVFHNALYVYNPVTSDYKKLHMSIDFVMEELIFGFGFSPVTKEYKVIKIAYIDHPWCCPGCTSEVQVFGLNGNSWRSIREAGYQIDPFSSQGIMLNGKMHWLTQLKMYYGRHDRLIVSFDLADELFAEVPKVDFNVDPIISKNFVAVKPDLPHELIFLSRTTESDEDQLLLGLSLNSKHTAV